MGRLGGWGLRAWGVGLVVVVALSCLSDSASGLTQAEIQAIRKSRSLSRSPQRAAAARAEQHQRIRAERAERSEAESPDVFVPKSQAFIRSSAPLRPAQHPRRPAAHPAVRQPPAPHPVAKPTAAELQEEERQEEERQREAILDKAEDEFIEHEQPRAIHDCGIYGNDCNYKGVGDSRDVGNYMKSQPHSLKARFQSLAQSWLPNCDVVDCGKQLDNGQNMVKRARAHPPQILGQNSLASAAAQLRYDHQTDQKWGKGQRVKGPKAVRRQIQHQVSLSNQDIKKLAEELYKEASDPDRMRAEAKQLSREVKIRGLNSQPAVSRPSTTQPRMARRTRHLIPANQPLVPSQPRLPVARVQSKLRPMSRVAYQGSFNPAQEMARATAPQPLQAAVPEAVSSAQSLEDGAEGSEGAEAEAEPSGDAEASTEEPGAEGSDEAETGACCDWEGNCNKCPGPDEEYNFLDNIYIFPGDHHGVGRSILHIIGVLILLGIILLIFQYILERQKAETGEDPWANMTETMQGWGQNIVDALETVWNSIKDCLGLGNKTQEPERKPLTQSRVV